MLQLSRSVFPYRDAQADAGLQHAPEIGCVRNTDDVIVCGATLQDIEGARTGTGRRRQDERKRGNCEESRMGVAHGELDGDAALVPEGLEP